MPPRPRAPRNTLSRELVVDTALRMLDEGGIEAFGVRALAKELGVGPMTLYTYFRGKEELLDAVRGQLLDTASLTCLHGDWQHRVRTICQRLRQLILDHPCLIHLLSTRPPSGRDAADAAEALLRTLTEAGFDEETAARTYTMLLGHVLGVTSLEVQLAAEHEDPDRRRHIRDTMTGLDPKRHPALVAHTAALRRTAGGDAQFEFGLELIIAGLERHTVLK
ncbi:AcrR family transcriptional regulator [Kutzneria viridogrisea]|uniref:AcrR family transcriptional regulator n=1 Tax=Kutzneria viridogrisea TaxID=47990 RepID=A0ABR6BPJ4_9PSEU|nr:AcrR family transcriptional regulator [Kutzneria viridogrisea]